MLEKETGQKAEEENEIDWLDRMCNMKMTFAYKYFQIIHRESQKT